MQKIRTARTGARASGYPNYTADKRSGNEVNYIEVSRQVSFELTAHAVVFTITVESKTLAVTEEQVLALPEVTTVASGCSLHADQVCVTSVATQSKSGLISSGTLGRYGIEITVPYPRLPEVVEKLFTFKNVEVHRAEWLFPSDDGQRLEAIEQATGLARGEAEVMCKAMGASLSVPHRAWLDITAQDAGAPPAMRTSKVASAPFLSLAAKRTVTVKSVIQFTLAVGD